MVDIGPKTGLFEALAGAPATSRELAERARLDERYAGFTAVEVFEAPAPQNSIYICHRGG